MIKIHNLSKHYGRKKALKDFTLSVGKHEVVGILGPNGSGKSTLMKISAGLLPSSKGSIKINDLEPSAETKAMVSYLSDSNVIPPRQTIKDTMIFYTIFFKDFSQERFLENLETLRLGDELNTKIKKLSKGMQQKLRLALTMARNASLYLLDEPLGGIDPLAREEILDTLIDNMHEESTMIITTHLVSEIEHLLTRVAYIHNGELIGDYSCEQLRIDEGLSVEDKYKEVFKNA